MSFDFLNIEMCIVNEIIVNINSGMCTVNEINVNINSGMCTVNEIFVNINIVIIVKMYKDKEAKKNVKTIFLSMCDIKVSLTFTSLNMVLL
jgi:hypothetical protein